MADTSTERRKSQLGPKTRLALCAGILVLLVGLLLMSSGGPHTRGKISQTQAEMQAFDAAVQSYLTDNGVLPKKLDNPAFLGILTGSGSRDGKAYMSLKPHNTNANGELVDAWKNPYRITRISDTELKIESAGPDGKFGTADDITNQ